MKPRRMKVAILVASVLLLSIFTIHQFAAPVFALSCPPDVVFGCYVYGAGSFAWYGWTTASSTYAKGLVGRASATSGRTYGVAGQSDSPSGYGMSGWASSVTGVTTGVEGYVSSSSGDGVRGTNVGTTGAGSGVSGYTQTDRGTAVYGNASPNNGTGNATGGFFNSNAENGTGVWGSVQNPFGFSYGVYGTAAEGNPNSYAGVFDGPVQVNGEFFVNGPKNFRIDHPLDPANKYLPHASVESPDMMNIYNGNVTTDANGDATVTLPAYFEALNRDFRYQLTVIGQFAQVIVASEIKDNSFTIKTDKPNVKVSWQVTGIRNDPYAAAHPFVVEQDKPAEERGTYLYPEGYGQAETAKMGYNRKQQLQELLKRGEEIKDRLPAVPPASPDPKPYP